MAAPVSDLLTIDQLAERTGISVRTIRFYAGRGLLPAPQLRGRTGLYGPGHLARLELVSELSALGFTLAAIEAQLAPAARRRRGRGARPAPGAAHAVGARAGGGADRRRAGPPGRASLSPSDLEALEGLGVITRTAGGARRLHGPAMLGQGLEVLDSGLPTETWRRAHAIIERHTTALAEDLMAMFQDEVLQPYRDRGRPAEERARLAAALAQLKPITVRGVVTAFGRAVNRTIRQRLG